MPSQPEGFLYPDRRNTMNTISGAQAVIKALEREGVDIVFGVPTRAGAP
jgi:hypothetical protein